MTLTNLSAENYDGTSTLPSATGTNSIAIGVGVTRSTSGVTIDGGAGDVTLASDVTFTGDNYNVLWDKSADDLVFDQGTRLDFGGGASIRRRTSGIFNITGSTSSDTYFNYSNSLLFYRSGSLTLSLGSSGISVIGNISVSGTVDGRDVATDGTKLDGIAAGANVGIAATGGTFTGAVTFSSSGNEFSNGVTFSNQNTVFSAGASFSSGNVLFGNNDTGKIIMGGSSLQIGGNSSYYGNRNIIDSGLDLKFLMGNTKTWGIYEANASDKMMEVHEGGGIDLYYNRSKKLEVTNTGATVTGNIVVTGTVDGRDIATNIPSSLGSAGQVLTVNSGASAAEWADAGGGADLYAANESSPTAQPSATGANAIAIGDQAVSSGAGSVALGHSKAAGEDSFAVAIQNSSGTYGALEARSVAIGSQAKVASGATGGGVAIGNSALVTGNTAAVAFGFLATASGAESAAFGRQATAAGTRSVTAGRGYSSGTDSFAAGIGSTSTSKGALHDYSVALGYEAVTTGSNQIALGGGSTAVRVSEAYTLPTTDGTNGQVLTTDGSGAVTFADAGGGADLFAENYDGTSGLPSATGTNAVAIGSNSSSSGNQSVALGGSNASGLGAFAFGLSSTSSSIYSNAFQRSTASGQGSFAAGSNGNNVGSVAAGTGSMALATSYASGTSSFAAAIANNTSSYGATGANSIAIGQLSKASGADSFAVGNSNTASGERSISLGAANVASGYSSFTHGTSAKAAHRGKKAYASGQFSATGDAQGGQFILRVSTTDATPTVLTTDNGSGLNNSQIIAASNTCITFSGTVVAMQNGAQSYGSWEVRGLLVNDGGTTTLPVFNISEIGSSGWRLNLYADNTNNALNVQATGVAATNIRWVANIATSEVTYA